MSVEFDGAPGEFAPRTPWTGRSTASAHSGSARAMRRAHCAESHMHRVCIITLPHAREPLAEPNPRPHAYEAHAPPSEPRRP